MLMIPKEAPLRRLVMLGSMALVAGVAGAQAPAPGFSKQFSPDTIAPGSVSTLVFTIDNSDASGPAGDIQFSDTLPAGVSIATPAAAGTTCSRGTISAPDGGSTITFSGGGVEAGATCAVSVDVTSSTPGTHTNVSGDMTSDAGNSGSATDDLVVDASLPQFDKAFSPDTIPLGGTSTLTFTIDNTANGAAIGGLDFTDNLPSGVVVEDPANAITDCTGGTLTASPGSSVISYSTGTVGAASSCTISVDVAGEGAGSHLNTAGNLTSDAGNSGSASATLTVEQPPRPPDFRKLFTPSTIPPGGVSELQFTIDHNSGTVDATSLDFTDNLPAGVVVASPANATTDCTGGTITATSGSGVISYSGGSVTAGAVCTVDVNVTSDAIGTHANTSGDLTSSLGNSGSATDDLIVDASLPQFAKAFSPDTIPVGGTSTLTFTIDNTVNGAPIGGLDFTDNLPSGVVVASPANGTTTCTGGTLTATPGSAVIFYTGGTVSASATCTVEVDVTGQTAGSHLNVAGDLTSDAGNSGSATDELIVVVPVPALPTVALMLLIAALAFFGFRQLSPGFGSRR